MTTNLIEELASIATWDKTQTDVEWCKLTSATAGRHLSVKFPRKALAFEKQCKVLGGHGAALKQQLRVRMKNNGRRDTAALSKPTLTPASQLVREWNGRIHRVLVTDEGFEMDGQSYRSLSAIAKQITGAGWSGPRFFGLSQPK